MSTSRRVGSPALVRKHSSQPAWSRALKGIRRLVRTLSIRLHPRRSMAVDRVGAPVAVETRAASVDLVRLRLRVGGLEVPFTPADLLNPEEFDPAAEAVVVLQGGRLRGIIFGRLCRLGLANVLRLTARAGRLRPLRRGVRPRAEIWVDPLGGIYDVTHLEVVRVPAVEFLGPVACSTVCGVA